MTPLTPLPPTDLYCIEVPKGAKEIQIHGFNRTNNILYYTTDGDCHNIKLANDYTFLGTVTKEAVSFDCNEYVKCEVFDQTIGYYDYSENVYKPKWMGKNMEFDKNASLRSLLTSNGVYFDNPMQKPSAGSNKKHNGQDISADSQVWHEQWHKERRLWQTYEDKLITGKLLILTKQ